MTKSEVLKVMIDFFHEQGHVPSRSEYYKLGPDVWPINPRLLTRYFRGRGYNSIVKTAAQMYPADWNSIGSKPVEEPKPMKKPVIEPASEDDLSPLEKLKSIKGESIE